MPILNLQTIRLVKLKSITALVGLVLPAPLTLFILSMTDSKKVLQVMERELDRMQVRVWEHNQRKNAVDHVRRNNLLDTPLIYVNPFRELVWQDSENLFVIDGVVELTIRNMEEEEIMSENDFLFFFEYQQNG